MPESGLIYVAKYLAVNDLFALASTCHNLYTYDELFGYFYHGLVLRLPVAERKYLQKLKYTFFCSDRKAITAYTLQKLWKCLSIQDQMECYSTRRTILLYLVAVMVRHGKDIIAAYNKHINSLQYTNKSKLRWLCSSWEILKGRRRVFRRNFLTVY